MSKTNFRKAFNADCKSFRAALRFVIERAALEFKKVPVAPAKDLSDAEAKTLKDERKNVSEYNTNIRDAIAICEKFGLSYDSLKKENISAVRSAIIAAYPYKSEADECVTFKKISDLKGTEFATAHSVALAAWIDVIYTAGAEKDIKAITGLKLTTVPVCKDGHVIVNAAGDIVTKNGSKFSNAAGALKAWDAAKLTQHLAK